MDVDENYVEWIISCFLELTVYSSITISLDLTRVKNQGSSIDWVCGGCPSTHPTQVLTPRILHQPEFVGHGG